MSPQCKCFGCGRRFERKPNTAGKWCSRECYYTHRHGQRGNPEDRFWARVDRSGGPDACWIWQGALNPQGRGQIYITDRLVLVHRYSWTLANGPIPDGLNVCHDCPTGDNPACVNPRHLWLGTQLENIQDCSAKGRINRATGELSHRAKLTWPEVKAIRLRYAIGGVGMPDLAREYGVSTGAIEHVICHRSWTDLH